MPPTASDTGQVSSSAAEIYDTFFLPALFAEWPPRLVAEAGVRRGMKVLDVACGTGALALEAARAVGSRGAVAGVDVNAGMLAVARRKAPAVDWREAPAEALPFDDHAFDAVLSQFGLMFFRDGAAALREMHRVLRPGGRMVVAVWAAIEHAPGYRDVTRLLGRLFGDDVADALRAPYALGEEAQVAALLTEAGIADARIERVAGEACFPSIRSWMHTDVKGWTLSDRIDDTQLDALVREAERELAHHVAPDGRVRFPHPAVVVTATKG
jgi:ubiquinone/menaquinone biosynthesis C-methylase UbiE